jgi:hypothetical protein
MIIARFGATYNAAYVFPRAGEVDTWRAERPPVYARVSGMSGAFDYWGDANYPWSPITLRKSFLVSGATYAAVQTAIDALKAATIDSLYESKLWMLRRDGVTTAYAWAKCTGLKISDQAGQIYFMRAEVEFYSREGISHIY